MLILPLAIQSQPWMQVGADIDGEAGGDRSGFAVFVCPDTDNDGHLSNACGGDDCNDCDGTVDESGTGPAPGWVAGNVGATNANSQFSCGANGVIFNITRLFK